MPIPVDRLVGGIEEIGWECSPRLGPVMRTLVVEAIVMVSLLDTGSDGRSGLISVNVLDEL